MLGIFVIIFVVVVVITTGNHRVALLRALQAGSVAAS